MNRADLIQRRIEIVSAYRRLFLTEDGRLKDDARIVFADVRDKAGLANHAPALDGQGRIDPLVHIYRDGARALFEHINVRVSTDLASLMNDLRATEE